MSNVFDINSFQTDRNYVIEASAGTGKTYSIVEIVKKLINNGISLDKILIVTYTEKAAEELKNRIRTAVPDANVDTAPIGTIHSFCKKTTEEFCITMGQPANLTVIDESEAYDFARQYIRSDKIFPIIEKMIFEGEKEDGVVKRLAAIAEKYYLDRNNNVDRTIISLATADDVTVSCPDETTRIVIENYKNGKQLTDGEPENKLKSIIDEFLNSPVDRIKNELHDELLHSTDLKIDGRSYKANLFLESDLVTKQKIENLKGKIEEYDKAKNNFDEKSGLLFSNENINAFYTAWQQEKAKNCWQTYNDMIRNVREEVIAGNELLAKLKEKYDYAIIDEFQDTNQKQWDIFGNVFLDETHHITVVGDPKQSIYSFQGADLDVYKKAKDEIINSGGEELTLADNYRASQGIVESTNNFFNNSMTRSESFDYADVNYKKPFRFTYDGQDEASYWISEKLLPDTGDDTESEKKTDKIKTQENYAKIICQTIADCCQKDAAGNTKLKFITDDGPQNVSFKDFAVLAKTGTEMPPIIRAFEESGIPYIRYKDASLFTGIECAHWIALLEAIDAPDFSGTSRGLFRKALYTRFFERSLEEINYTEFDKDNIPETKLFDRWRRLAEDARWVELFNSIIIDTELEKRLNSLSELKSYGTFRQVGAYCISYLEKANNLYLLIRNLRKLSENHNDEDTDNDGMTELTTDFDCVKIMTMHASKGLEFPIVISVGGFKKPRPSEDIYTYHNANNEKVLSLAKDARVSYEEEKEWMRLFYVAYTRAKYVLILPRYEEAGMDFIKNSIDEYIAGGFPYRSLRDSGESFDDIKAKVSSILVNAQPPAANGKTEDAQRAELKDIISHRKEHSSYKHAYSSLTHGAHKEETMSDVGINVDQSEETEAEGIARYDTRCKPVKCLYNASEPSITLSDGFPAGTGLGNAIHEVFELADYMAPADSPANRELIEKCFKKEGFSGKYVGAQNGIWTGDVINIVENVLNAKLPVIHGAAGTGATFKLKDIAWADRKNEVEFNFNRDGQWLHDYFNGFIDLIIKQGEYYGILDWKSDRLNDDFTSYSDEDIMKKHIDDLYSIQRVLYSYCLIKWLENYYPGLSDEEIFAQHFGGVFYVCLRGCMADTGNGIYAQTWESFKDIEDAYNLIVKERVGA